VIVTRIVGGLGNQMFQYAVGRAVSIASAQAFKLDLTEMERYTLHSLQLDQFNIQAEIALPEEVPFPARKSLFGRTINAVRNRRRINQVFEKSLSFNSDILELRSSAYLSGYWQSEKYFSAHADTIRRDFSLKRSLSRERLDTLAKICKSTFPVSVHVRRGDYVTNAVANSIHGTCEPGWYRTAMTTMTASNPTFFVFSDDPNWARENLPAFEKMYFVEPQADGRDAEDMHLMASCRSHIIANSTFSWWGAWLNPDKAKKVIAPSRWFRTEERNSDDILPSDWYRL